MEQETTYKFEDLSPEAKSKARDAYRYSSDYPYYDWWDSVYEAADEVASTLGITIDRCRGGRSKSPSISFEMHTQGYGASFSGDYRFNPKAVDLLTEGYNDPELLRIAKGLSGMQLAQRMLGLDYFTASIQQTRSNNVRTGIHDYGYDEVGEPDEDEFQELISDFADWIYKRLEEEYDYLMSDEVVDEALYDLEFDEYGGVL
jgi:hypothetical protein